MTDEQLMRRALDLAPLGLGAVSPNPLVGCVVVFEDKIIGEGWHQRYSQAHAEVNAVNEVLARFGETEAARLLAEATAYVTLEPCSHWGKTPPCADLLVRHRLRRVVVCNDDPNPLVAGQGLQKLREAGMEVETGLLADEGRWLNRRFFTNIEKKRPYVVLKWAESADGFIAKPDFGAVQISNSLSRQLVHKWRREEDAILVGTRTARYDNPQLTAREWPGPDGPGSRNPVRVVIDRLVTLPPTLRLFDGTTPTLCYTTTETPEIEGATFVCLDPEGEFLPQLLADLHRRRLGSVLVEGGAATLKSFLESGLWDEIRLFRSPVSLGMGIAAPRPKGRLVSREDVVGDEFLFFVNG